MKNLEQLRKNAMKLRAKDFGLSWRKNKRFYVDWEGTIIHFGSKNGKTFIDHGDEKKKKAWRARHSQIKLGDGRFAYKVKESPEYWSWNLLW